MGRVLLNVQLMKRVKSSRHKQHREGGNSLAQLQPWHPPPGNSALLLEPKPSSWHGEVLAHPPPEQGPPRTGTPTPAGCWVLGAEWVPRAMAQS